jgi:UDP-N-acetylglucosamine--N-acetylmuramyl-(pentapeptide) pyrophosphoryl-undecaprenol N-acetylglucosamine transferase
MKILIAAGGGGHFAAALSVISHLSKKDVVVMGRRHAFENDSVESFEYNYSKEKGITFIPITTGRIQRQFSIHTIPSLLKIPIGLFQVFLHFLRNRPDVVACFGGYTSFPVVVIAVIFRVPIVVHEQALSPGLANKFASLFARKILVSWEETMPFFTKKKTILTGNPIKPEFILASNRRKLDKKKLPMVYITGGSGGSHEVNQLVAGSLEHLLSNYTVLHQTGDAKRYNDYDYLLSILEDMPEGIRSRYIVQKFLTPKEIASAMMESDLIVSRAGINTVTEILFLGKPSLLIPLHIAKHDEQKKNAKMVKSLGLCEILDQEITTPDIFYQTIRRMIGRLDVYEANGAEAQKLIHRDASEKIAEIITTYASPS